MAQEEVSLWAEIKKHEDALAKDPFSYCFAPLAELYRKVGLLDEAVDVAKKGCGHHPDYVGGFMALGRAYFEKGLKNESREALERVVAVTPDNNLALKLLSQLYLDAGEYTLARNVLRSQLALNPDDVESSVLLKSMGREEGYPAGPADDYFHLSGNVAEILVDESAPSAIDTDLEEIDVVEELTEELFEDDGLYAEGVADDEDFFAAELPKKTPPVEVADAPQKDPLTTATLAELYVSQGFIPSALKIYHELLASDPDNQEYLVRCDELKALQEENIASFGTGDEVDDVISEPTTNAESVSAMPVDELLPESDENFVTAELELWLNNIRRMRDVI
jgi:tetratricopeptide (TPR) repeat protein